MFKRLGSLIKKEAAENLIGPGGDGTIADPALQLDLWQGLVMSDMFAVGAESAARDPCGGSRGRRVVRVEVLEAPTPASDTPAGWKGPWSERWTLDRCGVEIAYVIEFRPADDGGTDWRIQDPIEVGG